MSTSSNNEDNYDPTEKFRKYESDFTKYLMKKYFSDKDMFGEKIFQEDAKIGDGIIKSSRFPCTYTYADPLRAFCDQQKPLASSSRSSADPIEPVKRPRRNARKSSASRPSAEPVRPAQPDRKKSVLDLNAVPIEISSDEDEEADPCPDVGTSSGVLDRKSKSKVDSD